jgi:hypothetical protein
MFVEINGSWERTRSPWHNLWNIEPKVKPMDDRPAEAGDDDEGREKLD